MLRVSKLSEMFGGSRDGGAGDGWREGEAGKTQMICEGEARNMVSLIEIQMADMDVLKD